jgi:hypothetical protein
MDWTLISAVNNREVLETCLLASPGIRSASDVILEKGHTSAAVAYNAGLAKAGTDLVVFTHQDIYLPDTWPADVQRAIEMLEKTDANWGILGAWGPRCLAVGGAGFIYDGGWARVLGKPFEGGIEVETLDEAVLILRKSSGVKFDLRIPGFHMYGADVCTQARVQFKRCYAIAAFCIHNTSQYRILPWQFWKAYLAMRNKWRCQLPIRTSCIEITRWCWPMVRWNVVRTINLATGRDAPPLKRLQDPSCLYRDLISSGRITPAHNYAAAGPSSPCNL